MAIQAELDFHRQGLALAEAGRHKEALECIQQHLRYSPSDGQALNDAGAILHCLGRSDQALEYFRKAAELLPDSGEIIWNHAEACLGAGRPSEAAQLFGRMQQMGILSTDIINRTAKIFIDQQDKAGGIEMLLWSLEHSPNQQVLKPMIEIIRNKRPKIAFFCGVNGDFKFLKDILTFTESRFPVKVFDGQDVESMYELMKWSDISWFEWCTNMAVQATKLPKVCRNIVRLHRFEAYGEWPRSVNWENIDLLIMVGNSFVKDALISQAPKLEYKTKIATIQNGVNLDRYRFTNRPRGKNIACIGYLNSRKNPMFLLQCMQKLHYIDRDYRLFFAGVFQEPELEQYTMHMVREMELGGVVYFDGWQEDINRWLEDKHYVVSTSISESQGMGLLEGMACGLKPVVHNFPGANQIFPPECLFNISEDFCQQVTSGSYEPAKYRLFVEERYSLAEQLKQIDEILRQFESQIEGNTVSQAP